MADVSSQFELENARIVAEDLDFLINSWALDISESNLRRGSPMLRQLLVGGAYARAWRFVGLPRQPSVKATNLIFTLGTINRAYVSYAYAGVASSLKFLSGSVTLQNPGVREADLMITSPGYHDNSGPLFIVVTKEIWEAFSRDESAAAAHFSQKLQGQIFEDYSLSKFLQSASVIVKDTVIERRDIIQYVANKLGGAHFDPSRKLDKPKEQKYRLLDKQHANFGALSAIYLELLSIGQWVAESKDAKKYLEAFSQVKAKVKVAE